MKKIISMFLSAVICFSVMSMGVFNASAEDFNEQVVNLHLTQTPDINNFSYSVSNKNTISDIAYNKDSVLTLIEKNNEQVVEYNRSNYSTEFYPNRYVIGRKNLTSDEVSVTLNIEAIDDFYYMTGNYCKYYESENVVKWYYWIIKANKNFSQIELLNLSPQETEINVDKYYVTLDVFKMGNNTAFYPRISSTRLDYTQTEYRTFNKCYLYKNNEIKSFGINSEQVDISKLKDNQFYTYTYEYNTSNGIYCSFDLVTEEDGYFKYNTIKCQYAEFVDNESFNITNITEPTTDNVNSWKYKFATDDNSGGILKVNVKDNDNGEKEGESIVFYNAELSNEKYKEIYRYNGKWDFFGLDDATSSLFIDHDDITTYINFDGFNEKLYKSNFPVKAKDIIQTGYNKNKNIRYLIDTDNNLYFSLNNYIDTFKFNISNVIKNGKITECDIDNENIYIYTDNTINIIKLSDINEMIENSLFYYRNNNLCSIISDQKLDINVEIETNEIKSGKTYDLVETLTENKFKILNLDLILNQTSINFTGNAEITLNSKAFELGLGEKLYKLVNNQLVPIKLETKKISKCVFNDDSLGDYVIVYNQVGDVNNDGSINTLDALFILKHIANLEYLNDKQIIDADVNCDNTMNTLDSLTILQFIAGLD